MTEDQIENLSRDATLAALEVVDREDTDPSRRPFPLSGALGDNLAYKLHNTIAKALREYYGMEG